MSGACRIVFCLICLQAFAGWANAGALQWEQTIAVKKAAPGEKKLEFLFPFTNTGKEPVQILDIKPSCSCTTADTPKKTYEPGEKGEVKAVFTVGRQTGHEEKTISIQTAEKDVPPYVLTLRVDIPETVKINKKTLTWLVDDPLEPQSFEITVTPPVQVLGVQTLSKNFSLKLEEIEAAKTYRLTVTPASTDKAEQGMVFLEVAGPEKRTISLPVAVE